MCPENRVLSAQLDSLKNEVNQLLANSVLNYSAPESPRPCESPCGGAGWTRVVHLDMTDSSQQCPRGFRYYSSPVRGCAQSAYCTSAFYSADGRSYSHVCGRVNAYQYGTTDAFHAFIISSSTRTIEQEYFGGVSITHGQIGSRKHIWSFVAAFAEITTDHYITVGIVFHRNVPAQI